MGTDEPKLKKNPKRLPSDDEVRRTELGLLDQLIRRNPDRAEKIIAGIKRSEKKTVAERLETL